VTAPVPADGHGEDAVLAVIAEHGKQINGPMEAWDRLTDALVALVAKTRGEGEQAGAEAEYTAVYERHCRKVDPDLEGYGTDELVGRLLGLVKEQARAEGAEDARRTCGCMECESRSIDEGQSPLRAENRAARPSPSGTSAPRASKNSGRTGPPGTSSSMPWRASLSPGIKRPGDRFVFTTRTT
jgi:hypothetical protein